MHTELSVTVGRQRSTHGFQGLTVIKSRFVGVDRSAVRAAEYCVQCMGNCEWRRLGTRERRQRGQGIKVIWRKIVGIGLKMKVCLFRETGF